MVVLVFEDEFVPRLHPITLGRPAYAIGCGSFRLIDGLRELRRPIHAVVRSHLAELQRVDFADVSAPLDSSQPVLAVNARVVPSATAFRRLRAMVESGNFEVVRQGGVCAAAYVPPGLALANAWLTRVFEEHLRTHAVPESSGGPLPLFDHPHDVIRQNMAILAENLDQRLAQGGYREAADGVFLGEGASLGPYVVSDARGGPILIGAQATVGPHSFLRGPAYIGPKSRVIEHSAIKDHVAIGHTAKIGGEVEASVVEPFTNKQHHGFLGHSYLGSWINLGAGTCNSDLKNTYGTVNMDYGGQRVATGMQFLGCIMGDYAKTAINTGIFTGKVIGACSMLYGFVTTNVPSFVNYARLFGQVTELPPDVMIPAQQRMFQRRNVVQRPCDIQLIHDMFELTREERQITGEALSL